MIDIVKESVRIAQLQAVPKQTQEKLARRLGSQEAVPGCGRDLDCMPLPLPLLPQRRLLLRLRRQPPMQRSLVAPSGPSWPRAALFDPSARAPARSAPPRRRSPSTRSACPRPRPALFRAGVLSHGLPAQRPAAVPAARDAAQQRCLRQPLDACTKAPSASLALARCWPTAATAAAAAPGQALRGWPRASRRRSLRFDGSPRPRCRRRRIQVAEPPNPETAGSGRCRRGRGEGATQSSPARPRAASGGWAAGGRCSELAAA